MLLKNFFSSIKWKMIIIYLLLILTSLQIIGIYFNKSLEHYLIDSYNETLETQINLIKINIEKYFEESDLNNEKSSTEIDEIVNNLFALNGVELSIINNNGIIISTTEIREPYMVGKKIIQTEVNRAMHGIKSEAIRVDANTGFRTKYIAVPLKKNNQNIIGIIFMKASIESVYDKVNNINKIHITAIIISLLITAIIALLLSRTITKPVIEITKKAERISNGDFDQKVNIFSNDEIGVLGETLNKMSLKLKEAISQAEEEKEKFSSILTNMSDGVIALNSEKKIIVVNQMALNIIELDYEEIIGKSINDIYKNVKLPKNMSEIYYDFEIGNIKKILKMKIKQINLSGLNQIETIIVLTDVTKEQKLEQTRKDFVANVSHELRTPLTTIKSYLDTLLDGAIEDKDIANKFTAIASQETDRMIRLVNDLLILSKMEDKSYQLNFSPVYPEEIVNNCVERFKYECKQRSIKLQSELPENLPLLYIDRDKIIQVFDNLISNAIRYTNSEGKITIKSYVDDKRLYFEVIDTGIGISKEHLSRLFERFYRVDKARSRDFGGIGLGLAITREIVKAHEGEISVESKINKGTTFKFYLPLRKRVLT